MVYLLVGEVGVMMMMLWRLHARTLVAVAGHARWSRPG